MDTLIVGGDHARNGSGLPYLAGGARELVQRAMIRLCLPRGMFHLEESLGSELYKLPAARTDIRERVALSYVQEALSRIREIEVEAVSVTEAEPGVLGLEIALIAAGEPYVLEVRAT